MPKKRRKLDRELEKKISTAKKHVELITAKINDIREEEILDEYKRAFAPVLTSLFILDNNYVELGAADSTHTALSEYNQLISSFESEYEI